ncbi:MAG: MlaD family protein [Deltaproteobacteria bacterium]|nr:MlaD family protein [Deltaproteobacteria bacterium]
MKTTAGTRLRVGIFVLLALGIGAAAAFAIGAKDNIFAAKTTYYAIFEDVGGLQKGNTVRVAGVHVGSVTEVVISESGSIEVYFRVIDDATHLVRGDPNVVVTKDDPAQPSFAAVGSKGLLGDRLIEVTVGSDEYPLWDPDEPIPVSVGSGIMALAERTLYEAEGTAHNLRLATDPFADQEFSNDLKEIARNLAKASGMLASGEGTIGALMTDEQLARDVKGAVKNLRSAGSQVAELGENLNRITKEIQHGDGTAHALVYGTEGAEAIANIRDTFGQLNSILTDIREGDGTINQLIYGELGDSFMTNLQNASDDIAFLTKEMREGKGTIGALLTDPSIYEDIKRLVGDLERNDILRALVRYSIHRDEPREPIEVEIKKE